MFDLLRHRSTPARTRTTRPPRLEALERRDLLSFGADFPISALYNEGWSVATASSANGTAVAAWEVETGLGRNIVAQLYHPDGTPNGNIITVSAGAPHDYQPAVAMNAAGGFAVSFTRRDLQHFASDYTDQYDLNVYCRVFDADGKALTEVVPVCAQDKTENTSDSDIAMAPDGSFVVTYTNEAVVSFDVVELFGQTLRVPITDYDIRGRRFSASGQTLRDGPFGIDTDDTVTAMESSVAMADDGSFVVAYHQNADILLKFYDSDATELNSRVVAWSSSFEEEPDVAVDAEGNPVVVWQEHDIIMARRLSASGALLAPLVVSDSGGLVEGEVTSPSVAMAPNGQHFVVSYTRVLVESSGAVHENATTVEAASVLPDGESNTIEEIQSLGQGFGSSVSVDGNGRYFLAYKDYSTHRVRGHWGHFAAAEFEVAPPVEVPEPPPPANVLAYIDSDNNLVVEGGDGDNVFAIRQQSNGMYKIEGYQGTRIHHDSWGSPSQASITMPTGINNLIVQTNGGNDTVYLNGHSSHTTAKDVYVYLGPGDDHVSAYKVHARDDFRLYGEGGNDSAALTATTVGYSTDTSTHYLELMGFASDQRTSVSIGDAAVQGYLLIDTLGATTDASISVFNSEIAQDLRIFTFGGADKVALTGLTVGDDLEISTGGGKDEVDITDTAITDRLWAQLGGGDDVLTLTDVSGALAELNGEKGHDELYLFGSVSFWKSASALNFEGGRG